MLNQRAAKILNVILTNSNTTIKQLEMKLKYTRRQINYSLEKINDWLYSNRLPQIENTRDKGLVLAKEAKPLVYELLSDLDLIDYLPFQGDREKLIYIKLFIKEDYLSVNHFTHLIKMSRNTILSHIQSLKDELLEHNIHITYNRKDGYELSGDELTIRSVAFKYITHLLQLTNGKQMLEEVYDSQVMDISFQNEYTTFYQIMTEIEKTLHVSFVEEQLSDLTIFYLFLAIRMKYNTTNVATNDFIHMLDHSDAYYASQKLTDALPFDVKKSENIYIAMHLLGLNTTYLEGVLTQIQDDTLTAIIEDVISNFEKIACITISNRDEAKRNLLQHLKPAYYRTLFEIPITNPYLNKIKQEYVDLYTLVRKALNQFEKELDITISEDEVGFVTLHFGAFLKKHKLSYRRRKCIIICPNGVSTSYMLKRQMEQLFPEINVAKVTSPREYEQYNDENIDFIITTVPIKSTKPTIVVSPILTDIEKSELVSEVNLLFYRNSNYISKGEELMRAIRQHATIHDEKALYHIVNQILTGAAVKHLRRVKPLLNELLTESTIQLADRAANWRDAISLAAAPLVENHAIEEKYIDAMIKSVENIGPYIVLAPKVAIPHARPEDGVNAVGMSFLKLNEAVSFEENNPEKDVQLIFVIAAIDNEMHLKALSQLTELLEDEAVIDEMIAMNDKDAILAKINQFS